MIEALLLLFGAYLCAELRTPSATDYTVTDLRTGERRTRKAPRRFTEEIL